MDTASPHPPAPQPPPGITPGPQAPQQPTNRIGAAGRGPVEYLSVADALSRAALDPRGQVPAEPQDPADAARPGPAPYAPPPAAGEARRYLRGPSRAIGRPRGIRPRRGDPPRHRRQGDPGAPAQSPPDP